VLETLTRLEQQLNRAMAQVRNGINEVATNSTPAQPPETMPSSITKRASVEAVAHSVENR